MSYRRIILLILAVVVLGIISWDYTSGHTFEEMLHPMYCPVCAAFVSVEIGVLLLMVLILVDFVPVVCCRVVDIGVFVPALTYSSVSPDRAPPAGP